MSERSLKMRVFCLYFILLMLLKCLPAHHHPKTVKHSFLKSVHSFMPRHCTFHSVIYSSFVHLFLHSFIYSQPPLACLNVLRFCGCVRFCVCMCLAASIFVIIFDGVVPVVVILNTQCIYPVR